LSGGGVTIQHVVKNYAPVQVQQTAAPDGLSTETVIRPIEDALSSRLSRGKGSLSKTVSSRANNTGLRG
jgi:hypothetical protein